MRSKHILTLVALGALALAGCASEPAGTTETAETTAETTDAVEPNPEPASSTGSNSPVTSAPERQPQPAVERRIVPSGTAIPVILIDAISTETHMPGDVFLAALAAPIAVNGTTVIEEGTRVRGRIVDVQEPGRVRGRARIEMVLTEIAGSSVSIPISTASFVQEAEQNLERDAALGAAGTAAGAVVGGLAGGRTGAIIGGAAGGTGTVIATRGDQLEYPAESRLTFTLNSDVALPAGRPIS